MSKKSQAYDHAAYLARYSATIGAPAIAASVSAGKFVAFAAMRIKSIHGAMNIAGTNTASGYDILNGTSSIGEFVCSTNAAGSILTAVTPSAADGLLAENGFIDIKTKAASATQSASFAVEYELVPACDITA